MTRKRQEGVTSFPRYLMKMYKIGLAISGGNELLAQQYAMTVSQARAMGIGTYKNAWTEAKGVLTSRSVPSSMFGLYRAFTLELVNKVQRRGIASPEQIIERWTEQGLDPNILREIYARVHPMFKPETSSPASKVT